MNIVAATKVSDALRPKSEGEPVNVHVVPQRKVPEPDFEAMQRLISGGDNYSSKPSREISEDDRAAKPVAAFLG